MNTNIELAPTNTSRNNAVHQDTNIHSNNVFLVDCKFAISGEPLELRSKLAVEQIGAKQAKPTAIPSTCIQRKRIGRTEKSNSKGSRLKKKKNNTQNPTKNLTCIC